MPAAGKSYAAAIRCISGSTTCRTGAVHLSHAEATPKNQFRREKTMRIHWTAIAGMAVMLSTASHAQTNRLAAAAEAMGATTLNTIQFTGSGNVFSFGQAFEP